MKTRPRSNRPRSHGWLVLAASIVWGLVELLALQRSRFHTWRATRGEHFPSGR